MWRRLLSLLSLLCLCAAMAQMLPAAWILIKAELAQVLIGRAWAADGAALPWPWADTWPVMRLQAPRLGVDLYVLEGATGNALAFGPGRSRPLLAAGASLLISGHRDTHFSFLQDLRVGDTLRTRGKGDGWQRWKIASLEVVDSRSETLPAAGNGLLLVTCYPFHALEPGGPLRYVAHAYPD